MRPKNRPCHRPCRCGGSHRAVGVGEQGFTASHGDPVSQTWPLTILPLKCWSQILVRSHLPSPSPPPDCMRALLMKGNRLGLAGIPAESERRGLHPSSFSRWRGPTQTPLKAREALIRAEGNVFLAPSVAQVTCQFLRSSAGKQAASHLLGAAELMSQGEKTASPVLRRLQKTGT